METHFCNCRKRNISDTHKGCDPCIKDNLKKVKCLPVFRVVHDDMGEVRGYTISGFIDFFQQKSG